MKKIVTSHYECNQIPALPASVAVAGGSRQGVKEPAVELMALQCPCDLCQHKWDSHKPAC